MHGMKILMTFEEMIDSLEVWDQTIGCNNCGNADWAEQSTDCPSMFHKDACPLKGRLDVLEGFSKKIAREQPAK